MEPEKGLIVCASAGRDKGKFFAVLECNGGYALIADGKTRKLSHPKRKNVKHFSITGKRIALTQITDKKLRDLLKEFTI
jgi:ribosomal protein L14E/L6E/L27E